MTELRSNFKPGSTRWAVRRSQWIAMGIDEADFDKPKIAVVNSSSSLSVCYAHLDEASKVAQQSIRESGGLPFEIHTVAPSDFITSAGKKARYLMPSRDLLVNDVEVMVEGACLDGMLMLGSCDKTTPGQLMAAARLNIPAIVVPCGYQLGGKCGGKEVDIEEVYKAVGSVATGQMQVDELEQWTRCAIKGPGVCAGLATANSMHCMAEALGMALAGTTPIRAGSDRLNSVIAQAGRQIVELIRKDIRPRDILTEGAFRNAVSAAISIGASVNTVRHLCAIAHEAQLDIDVIRLFEELAQMLPLLVQVRPNGSDRIEDFDHAGGTLAVMKQLSKKLDLRCSTVNDKTLGQVLDREIHIEPRIIRPLDRPHRDEPGLIIIRGNLAPNGAIVKLSAVPAATRHFEGTARVYEDEDDALTALSEGNIQRGDVVVLRMMGPKGGPGTVFACSFMAALVGAGIADDVAVVTDGELSGLNRGITVGQVMPEAARGGPLAVVRDGDVIRIELDQRTITVRVSSDELQQRLNDWRPPVPTITSGWLHLYGSLVQPIEQGAVLSARNPDA
jgi:dihydroxy-acid dehydratase